MDELKSKIINIVKFYDKIDTDIFKCVNSYLSCDLFDIAKNYIDKILKYQGRNGSFGVIESDIYNPVINFLIIITNYFNKINNDSISNKEQIETNFNIRKEVKKYIKSIRRCKSYLESNFDEVYLLLFSLDENKKKKFKVLDNVMLLSVLDELTQVLNQFDYHKEADFFFMLKGKIELGFNRYFWHDKEKVLLKWFCLDGNFQVISSYDFLEVLKYYNFSKNLYRKCVDSEIKNLKNYCEFEKILNVLIGSKNVKSKSFEIEFKKVKDFLEYCPKLVLSDKEFELQSSIYKSINKEFDISIVEVKKDKRVLFNLYDLEVANLILELLK